MPRQYLLSTAENRQVGPCVEVQTHFPISSLQCGRGERQDSHPQEKEGTGTCRRLRPSQVEKGSKQVTLSGTEQQGDNANSSKHFPQQSARFLSSKGAKRHLQEFSEMQKKLKAKVNFSHDYTAYQRASITPKCVCQNTSDPQTFET